MGTTNARGDQHERIYTARTTSIHRGEVMSQAPVHLSHCNFYGAFEKQLPAVRILKTCWETEV